MGKPLHVLIVEDLEDDAVLLVRHLERGGFEPVSERVDDAQSMSAALAAKTWDVILCDYRMPEFSVAAALALVNGAGLDIPFIVVSGMIGEERAVDVMMAGAHDIVLKDNLARLVPAIKRELNEAETRRERERAEEALRRSEAGLRQIIDAVPILIFAKDRDGRFLLVNRAMAESCGLTVEELTGRLMQDVLPNKELVDKYRADDLEIIDFGREKHISSEPFEDTEGRTGVYRTVKVPFTPLGSDERAVLGVTEDITEYKRAEDALRSSEEQLRLITDNLPVLIGFIDSEKRYRFLNKLWESWFARPASEMLGLTIEEVVGEALYEFIGPRVEEALSGKLVNYENTIAYADGITRQVDVTWVPHTANGGGVVGSFLLVQDITERKKADRATTETVRAISLMVEKRDPYTSGHQNRVAQLSAALGLELGLGAEQITGLRFGAMIHDIGKIWIPSEILNRPGKLSPAEFELIKAHPEVGRDIIKNVEFPWPISEMISQHHERLDGSGYPAGLKDSDICLVARILTVADVVEAISAHRPYRAALGADAALLEILEARGSHYEPKVVDACLRLFRETGFTFQDP